MSNPVTKVHFVKWKLIIDLVATMPATRPEFSVLGFYPLRIYALHTKNCFCSFSSSCPLTTHPVYRWTGSSLALQNPPPKKWHLVKFCCVELLNHGSYVSLLNVPRWADRFVLKARMFWQAYLSDNPLSQFSPNIWTLPQTDAGNKAIATGATLANEVRGGILLHTPTLPPLP